MDHYKPNTKAKGWNIDDWLALAVIALWLVTIGDAQAMLAKPQQSQVPWTLAMCDKLAGKPATAAFNQSIYNRGGWPLWRAECVYK